MIEFAISLLFAALFLFGLFTLWFGAELIMLMRAVKKQANGLRFSPFRDYKDDRRRD